ncbi:MAG: phosphoenolpyruvate hydrolase family protein [Pseudomonadota bacterium]
MRLTDGNRFVVGVTAGSGAVAAISTHAGADFLLALNAARLRNMGAPSIACMLPLSDAAQLVDGYADTELLAQADIPILIGTNCWREAFDAGALAKAVLARGFAGIVNFPPSSLYPDTIQRRLEIAGVGFSAELEMLKTAQDAGCIAVCYCRTVSQGRQAALLGLDNILLNFGWNSGGRVSPSSDMTLDEAATVAASFTRQIRRIRPDTCLLLEGGPVESEQDLEAVLRHADFNGYIGGSTFERLPVERSIADRIASFKLAKTRNAATQTPARQLIGFGRRSGFVGSDAALLAALEQMHAARQARPQFLGLFVPKGDSMTPAVQAMVRPRGGGRVLQVAEFSGHDLADAPRVLFGDGQRPGACFDTQTDVVVLRHPEALDPSLQARLAAHVIETGVAASPSRLPRMILVSHDPPERMQPDLGALMRAALIELPALRARPNDVKELLENAMGNQAQQRSGPARAFSPAAILRLRSHDWPGNTAELVAMCAQFARAPSRKPVSLDEVEAHLAVRTGLDPAEPPPDGDRRLLVVDALKRNGFRKGQTAQALGISRKTLYNWMKREGLS